MSLAYRPWIRTPGHEVRRRSGAGEVRSVVLGAVGSRALTAIAYPAAVAAGSHHVAARWDAARYLRLASLGYPTQLGRVGIPQSDWAFFPLFPMCIRSVHDVTRLPAPVAGLLVNAAACSILGIVLWRLSLQWLDRAAARRANLLFWFFPGSAVLSMNYSEALFLACAVMSLLLLGRQHWVFAGLAGALSGLTRPAGIAVTAAALVASGCAIRRDQAWRSLAAPVISALGLLGFLVYSDVRTGHWNEWLRAEALWHQSIDLSIGLPAALLRNLGQRTVKTPQEAVLAAGLVGFVVVLWLCRRQLRTLPLPWLGYLVVVLGLTFGSTHVGSRPRFLLVMVPLFFALGARLSPRSARLTTAGFAVVLLPLTFLYLAPIHFVP